MKTQSAIWTHNDLNRKPSLRPAFSWRMGDVLRTAGKTALSLLPSFAIVVLAAWLTTHSELTVYLQVTLWTSGFLFLGLALDAKPPLAALLLASGIALPILALLSSSISAEIAIVGAMLIALWVAVGLLRRSVDLALTPQNGNPAGDV